MITIGRLQASRLVGRPITRGSCWKPMPFSSAAVWTRTTATSRLVRSRLLNQHQHQQQWRRAFSASKEAAAESTSQPITTTSSSSWWSRHGKWVHRFATLLRYLRIPALVLGVYGLGYQRGVMDHSREPQKTARGLLRNVLTSTVEFTEENAHEEVHILDERSLRWGSREKHMQAAVIGHQIIAAARVLVQEKYRQARQAALLQMPPALQAASEDAREEWMIDNNEEFEKWRHALVQVWGEDDEHPLPWQFIVLPNPSPNAFVNEMLPRRFFITTGMLELADNPDQLALVMGHEASHLMLGHLAASNALELTLQTVQVFLLSVDPTEGLLSLAIVGLLATLSRMVAANLSREHEREADELGCELAARACFDTRRGAKVMLKLHELAHGSSEDEAAATTAKNKNDNNIGSIAGGLLSTHPPSIERYEQLLEQSREENPYKYRFSKCKSVNFRFFHALSSSKE